MTNIIDLIKYFRSHITLKEFPKFHALAIAVLGSTLLLFSSITIPSNEAKEAQRTEKVVALAISNSADNSFAPTQTATLTSLSTESTDKAIELELGTNDLQKHTEIVKAGDNLSLLFSACRSKRYEPF